jgi:hypothetical protein
LGPSENEGSREGVVTKAIVAKTATAIGLDLLGNGVVLTAAGLATSYFVVKHNKNKIDLKELIENAN